jgi:O-antigen/teichoic acid export membrane protein
MATERNSNLSTLLSSASLLVVAGFVGAFSKLLERVIIVRALSPRAYGEVSIGIALLLTASTIATLGFFGGVPRFMSRFDDEANRRGVWLTGLLVPGAVTAVLTVVLFAGAPVLTRSFLEQVDSPAFLRIFVLCIPFVFAMRIGLGAIRGFEHTVYKLLVQDLLYPLLRIGLVAVLLFVAGFSVAGVGYAYFVAAAVSFVAVHYLLSRLMSLTGPFTMHTREMLRFSVPLVLSSILATLLTHTDTFMLGYFRSSAEVGQYTAAYPVANGLLIVLSSFGFVYLPLASRLDADGEHAEIDLIYKTTTKWAFVLSFPAVIAFLVFPRDILRIVFTAEYTPAAPALVILAVGYLSTIVCGRSRETLSALGFTNYLLAINGVIYALNFGLNLALIPMYGFLGAALSSSISLIGLNAGVVGVLKYRFDISPFSRHSLRTFVALPALLLPPAYALSTRVSLSALTLFPFLVVLGLLGIGTVVLVGGLQSEDRIVVRFVEDAVGVRVPLIRNYLPPE